MKAGLFLMPSHPPERPLYDAHQFDLDVIALADELGYQEAWIGEHFTAPWEPIPSPDLMIAQALTRTKNIKLGAGAHLLPYHHPAELALRIAYLDHLSQGRLLVGIGAGGLQTDAIMFDVDFDAGENREMTREALEIMLMLWAGGDEPRETKTKHWKTAVPDPKEWEWASLKHFLTPFQKPHPPIGVAAASPGSETLKIAGERGYIPMSLGLGPAYIASHWESVLEGAAARQQGAALQERVAAGPRRVGRRHRRGGDQGRAGGDAVPRLVGVPVPAVQLRPVPARRGDEARRERRQRGHRPGVHARAPVARGLPGHGRPEDPQPVRGRRRLRRAAGDGAGQQRGQGGLVQVDAPAHGGSAAAGRGPDRRLGTGRYNWPNGAETASIRGTHER